MPDMHSLKADIQANEEELVRVEAVAVERRRDRIKLARSMVEEGATQQEITTALNRARKQLDVAPITVDAIQKGLVRGVDR